MRRVLKIVFLLVGVLAVVLLLSPYWLSWALPSIARKFGATYDSYSRVGYSRFALSGIVVHRRNVTVKVAKIEAATPLLLLFHSATKQPSPATAGEWSVDVVRSERRPDEAARPEFGWTALQRALLKLSRGLERYLGEANIGAGTVHWPNGELLIGGAHWSGHQLHAENVRWKRLAADIDGDFDQAKNELRATASFRGEPWRLEATGHTDRVTATLHAYEQSAPLELVFEPTGWKPVHASLVLKNWSLPGEPLRLGQYAKIAGDASLIWNEGKFVLESAWNGVPLESAKKIPPLQLVVRAHGDGASYIIEQFDAALPGAKAHLSAPIEAKFHGGAVPAAANFALAVDLADLPWIKAKGHLDGEINANVRSTGAPILDFNLRGENVAYDAVAFESASAIGRFDWPRLTIDRVDVRAIGTSHATGNAKLDLHARSVDEARLEGHLSAEMLRQWLPPRLDFEGGDIVWVGHGPFAAIQNEGTVALGSVKYGNVALSAARAWWKGEGKSIEQAELGIQGGTTEVVATGSLKDRRLTLQKLVWRQHGEERLALPQPATIVLGQPIEITGFNLVGPAGEFHARGSWGEVGELHFSARAIAAEWWRDFTPEIPFDWSVRNLAVNAAWTSGPASVDVVADLNVVPPNRPAVNLTLSARTDQNSVVVEQLHGKEAGQEFATFTGQLPLQIFLGPHPRFEINRKAAMKIVGQLNPYAREWTELAQRTGVTLQAPDLSVDLDGTPDNPLGRIKLRAERVQLDPRITKGRRWPKIENLQAEVRANGAEIRLQQTSAKIEGQTLNLGAVLSLKEDTWQRLRKNPLEVLRDEMEVSLQATDVSLTDLAPLISEQLLPSGRLDADVTVSGRGSSKGYIRFRELGTHPVGSLGTLRDIHGDLELAGREIRVNDVSASLGGQVIRAEGRVNVPDDGAPKFEINILGEDLPFVRQAGLLIRGNVRLKIATTARGFPAAEVSGNVELHDGIFVSDIRALVPRGGGTSPQRRPPYFSVDVLPFQRWRLDVNVAGDQFLRARTTLFNGVVSAKLHLLGTLGEPRALGEVRIDEGQVMFPFARFQLNDATVRLTEENPYSPQLGIFGTSRRYGYDLRVEVTGNAETPNVVFSSNPPLSSEQVLLLVMAGETPQNEVTYTTSQRFARLGTFFGQSLLGSLSGGEGGDRLSVTSGERVSRGGRETYDVEYELGNRWTLIGEYDEFDEYNAGLKYRVLPKKKGEAR
ncbi:MAG TPA: translocation/assembly module TamB domain-containing protein [Opitutaceae bacterium]|nr:translocation/assembly module TamB domain-containing protein [Opitutaceae bacterium]